MFRVELFQGEGKRKKGNTFFFWERSLKETGILREPRGREKHLAGGRKKERNGSLVFEKKGGNHQLKREGIEEGKSFEKGGEESIFARQREGGEKERGYREGKDTLLPYLGGRLVVAIGQIVKRGTETGKEIRSKKNLGGGERGGPFLISRKRREERENPFS